MMCRKVIVTGAGGYVGSLLVPRLMAAGYQVVAIDKYVFTDPPESVPNSLEAIRADICHLDWTELEDVDAVIHLAAYSNDPSCDIDEQSAIEVNHAASVQLAREAKKRGVKLFIFASSCSVYGASMGAASTEASPLRPLSLYAQCKARTEEALAGLSDNSFHTIMLRKATLYGLSRRMRFDLVVNTMTLHAVQTGRLTVHGSGKQWRPLLHVSDAADAYLACLATSGPVAKTMTFNVVSENTRIIDLANYIAEKVPGTKIDIEGNNADNRDYKVVGNPFESRFDFRPKYDIPRGVEEIINAIRAQPLDHWNDSVYNTVRMWKDIFNRPASLGGKPVRRKFLPFALPYVGKEEEDEVIDTLRSGWITTGPKTKRFEQMCAEYVGCKHAVAVNSCTAALHLSVVALDIGPGDEVITSPISWPATANVILHQGAKPVFVDVEPDTLNIDAGQIASAVTERTKAIVPVHMAGQPCDMQMIHAIAREYGLAVIEDGAHAIGAEYNGRRIGSLSTTTAFSFYPIKNITTIEGGLLATDDERIAQRARILSLHGIDNDAWKRYGSEGSPHWRLQEPGFKYNMSDVQASLGLHQLPRLDAFIAKRQAYASIYDAAFADLPEIRPLALRPSIRHAHHLYIVVLDVDRLSLTRDEFILALRAENIGSGVHFISMHLQPYYQKSLNMHEDDLPNAARLSNQIVSLPLYPRMSRSDVSDVISAVRKIVAANRNTDWEPS